MIHTHSRRALSAIVLVAAVGLMGAACSTPPGAPIPTKSVAFSADTVHVNNSQDEVCVLGICANSNDEPYVLQIGFRVQLGLANSASVFTVGSRDNATGGIPAGGGATLTGAQKATANFANVEAFDVGEALNTANHLTVFGTYTWACEEDTIGIGTGLTGTASVLKDVFNQFLAGSSTALSGDANALASTIVNLIVSNIGSAFGVLLANIPTIGLGDDTLGGALYIGVGATGLLGSAIDSANASVPAINLLGDNQVPPKIVGGHIYSIAGNQNFTQTFNGAGGEHVYTFDSALS